MNTDFPTLHILTYPLLDSTNTKAKELANDGAPHGTVVIAQQQSAGRGRLGRRFFSPPGCGIYMSALIRPEEAGLAANDTVLLTTAASVAVARAVSRTLHKELQIKWVNDLYCRGKKVCGILTEGVAATKKTSAAEGIFDAVIVGIGVNYREPECGFPTELSSIAGALLSPGEPDIPTEFLTANEFATENEFLSVNEFATANEFLTAGVPEQNISPQITPTQQPSPTETLAKAIAEELFSILPEIKNREFLREYRERSLVLGRRIRVFSKGAETSHPDDADSGFRMARALDIDRDGGLMVRYEDGSEETLTTGEISIRLAEGL